MKYSVFFVVLLIISCQQEEIFQVEMGVSKKLASQRSENISKVNYNLHFDIPEQKAAPINANETIGFNLSVIDTPAVLDFDTALFKFIKSVKINDSDENYFESNGHLILPSSSLVKGYNTVVIDFIAGDMSLNRNEDYLYTLFVPDRASTAFPCFDQPDIKATYKLSLEIPQEWVAISNAKVSSEETRNDRKTIEFDVSDKISSYLFSFVAGRFQVINKEIDGFAMKMLHRETDEQKVINNADEIFLQHYEAIKWLESYTDIDYPFQKFDFALIPGFQYGGMEHVGAIQYRASKLMLEASATIDEKIGRTMLIAHETAHMWFGNLVTMKWFDDVWLKEVFANFMASKFTEQRFPEVSHELNFLFAHYPQAYSVDRTEGSNSIRQELENLKDAGNMYGAIIYHKAPIVMKQLERILGANSFRGALRAYLENFKWKNATWDDLVENFDDKTDIDIVEWSNVWIDEPGMPFIDIELVTTETLSEYDIRQFDLSGNGRIWPQYFSFDFIFDEDNISTSVFMDKVHYIRPKLKSVDPPKYIELNSMGFGYGTFSYGLDYVKDEFLFNGAKVDIPSIEDSVKRGAAYIRLHEFLLYEGLNPQMYYSFLQEYVRAEDDKLILKYLLENLELIFWKFLKQEQWESNALVTEGILWTKMLQTEDVELRHIILKKYISLAYSNSAIENLLDLWNGQEPIKGLKLSESEAILAAYQIALKSKTDMTEILDLQMDKMSNPDRKAKMNFIKDAISFDVKIRDAFFDKLLLSDNRSNENWVVAALYYLHHPVRASSSINYLKQSLEILPELQQTGDIFFPKRWLDNTFWGQSSPECIEIINSYLNENPNLNPQLKAKLLQATDMVFRADRDISSYYSDSK